MFDVIDRNLADFAPAQASGGSFRPKVDVRETPDAYILDMDLPGVQDKDVEISLKDRVLSISSKKDVKKEEKKEGEWLIHERHAMSFSRRFTLPQDIDADNVSAEFKGGVLTIDIPRKPETQSRQIAISTK